MKTALKRTLSLMLTVVMLVSCWVFAAPKASAGTDKYTIRLVGYTDNDYTPGNQRFYVTYRTNNGTGTTANTDWYSIGNSSGNCSNIWDSGGANYGYFPSTDGVAIDGFPVSYTVNMIKTKNGAFGIKTKGSYHFKLQIKKSNGWDDYGGTQTNNGNITKDTYYKGYIEHGSTENSTFNVTQTSSTMANSDFPQPTSTGTPAFSNQTFGATGSVSSSTTAPTGIVDQYNVNYKTANFSLTGATSDYSSCTPTISGLTVTVPTQVATSGDNDQVITANWKWASIKGDKTGSSSFTVTDHEYTATYKYKTTNTTDLANPSVTSQTTAKARYGDTPTKPSSVTVKNYYDNTKHYTSTTYNNSALTADTTFWPNYTGTAHGNWTYTEISNDNTFHTKKCGGCAYSTTPQHTYTNSWTSYDDEYHKDTCSGSTSCGHVKYQAHSYGATSFTWDNDNTTATASRTCSVCNHTQSAAATMTHTEKTAATCTEKGWNTYIATSPFANESNVKASKDVQDIPIDSTNHNFATPTVKDAALRTPATCTSDATYWYSCSRCGAVSVESESSSHFFTDEGSVLGHKWSEYTQVLAPTCTTVGSEQKTCSRCGSTEARDIPALGHAKVAVPSSPSDGVDAVGTVYFKCNNGCGTYWAAEYNAEKGEYDPSETEYSSIKQAKNNSEPVPAPEFNSFVDDDESTFGPEGYAYETRGASLKIAAPYEYTDENTKQGMRFTASLHVPEGVEIGNSGTGNRITDFGFVYTQTQYVDDDANFIIGKPNMYTMSVVNNNAGKGVFNGSNWTGVTLHDNDDYDGQTLTYNLVINVKARNWQEEYCARAFIKYSYNGFDYVVYDKETTNSSRNVAYIAQCVVDNVDGESLRVREYCQHKILDHLPS